MDEVLDADLRKRAEFLAYIKETEAMLEECLNGLEPGNSRQYLINIGLMTKIRKLYRSVATNINNGDALAAHILMRSFNEAAISLRYLLMPRKPTRRRQKYNEFVKTDAMRRRDQIKDLKSDSIIEGMGFPGFRDAYIAQITKSIEEDKFEISSLPKPPPGGSWHQGKSYLAIAASLGDVSGSTFSMLYSGQSNSVHPSWTEIKNNHIKPSDENPNLFIPDTNSTTIAFFAEYAVLICEGLKVCEDYMRYLINENRAEEIAQTHNTFHVRHTQRNAI